LSGGARRGIASAPWHRERAKTSPALAPTAVDRGRVSAWLTRPADLDHRWTAASQERVSAWAAGHSRPPGLAARAWRARCHGWIREDPRPGGWSAGPPRL